jgi:hypothetical protein
MHRCAMVYGWCLENFPAQVAATSTGWSSTVRPDCYVSIHICLCCCLYMVLSSDLQQSILVADGSLVLTVKEVKET